MADPEDRWALVGHAIERRMSERAVNQTWLVQRSGVSAFTVRKLMKGEAGNYQRNKLEKVSKALWGSTDVISRLIAGDDPASILQSSMWDQAVGEELPRRDAEEAQHALSSLARSFLPIMQDGSLMATLPIVHQESLWAALAELSSVRVVVGRYKRGSFVRSQDLLRDIDNLLKTVPRLIQRVVGIAEQQSELQALRAADSGQPDARVVAPLLRPLADDEDGNPADSETSE